MILKELKIFTNSIPEEMDGFTVVNGEFMLDKDGKTFIMGNNKVLTVYVDRPNKEVQFLHQTDKDVKNLIMDLDGDS